MKTAIVCLLLQATKCHSRYNLFFFSFLSHPPCLLPFRPPSLLSSRNTRHLSSSSLSPLRLLLPLLSLLIFFHFPIPHSPLASFPPSLHLVSSSNHSTSSLFLSPLSLSPRPTPPPYLLFLLLYILLSSLFLHPITCPLLPCFLLHLPPFPNFPPTSLSAFPSVPSSHGSSSSPSSPVLPPSLPSSHFIPHSLYLPVSCFLKIK